MERLIGLDASEVLPKIAQGDPLGIQTITMRRLRERALLIDPERAFHRALTEVALDVECASPGDLRGGWIQDSVDRALARIVRQDQEEEREFPGEAPRDSTPYMFVKQACFVALADTRRASVEFHALPHRTRMAFFLLLIDGMDVDDCLALGHWEPEELRLDIWEALCALGHVTREEVEGFRCRKKRT